MIRFKMNGFYRPWSRVVALKPGRVDGGNALDKAHRSIKAGAAPLGSLALIISSAYMLGKMLTDCGGAFNVSPLTLIAKFGKSIFSGLSNRLLPPALFYEVGFHPDAAAGGSPLPQRRISWLLYRRRADIAGGSSPVATRFAAPGLNCNRQMIFHDADMGKTLLFGTILAIPTVILLLPTGSLRLFPERHR